jgi:hypothetical protein
MAQNSVQPSPGVTTTSLAVVLFCGLFGIMFIVIGIRRVLASGRDANPIEAIFWGAVGIAVGIGFFAAIVWLVR